MKTSRLIALLTLLLLGAANSAWACSACWGDTSGSTKGSNAAAVGIGAMVVIVCLMLGAVAGFAWHLVHRAKHPLPDYDELLSDDSNPDDPKPKA
jgi:hypothetical protein